MYVQIFTACGSKRHVAVHVTLVIYIENIVCIANILETSSRSRSSPLLGVATSLMFKLTAAVEMKFDAW